jgi:CRISPR-associated protein Csx10
VWGLRKPAGVCFQAGSSFLIGIAQADNNKLFRLQCEGIGERCNEGFGRIVFGWQQDDVSPKATTTPKPQPPECPMPGLTKEIVETALKELFMKQVKLDALQKAQEFIKLPTRALLGRLEAMVATLEKDQFVEVLEKKLRKTAREKLDQCRGKSETFLDFLKTYEVNLEDMLKKKEYASFQKLAEVIHFSPNHDATFVKETNRLYLTTLLAFMRKSVKRQKGGA